MSEEISEEREMSNGEFAIKLLDLRESLKDRKGYDEEKEASVHLMQALEHGTATLFGGDEASFSYFTFASLLAILSVPQGEDTIIGLGKELEKRRGE